MSDAEKLSACLVAQDQLKQIRSVTDPSVLIRYCGGSGTLLDAEATCEAEATCKAEAKTSKRIASHALNRGYIRV